MQADALSKLEVNVTNFELTDEFALVVLKDLLMGGGVMSRSVVLFFSGTRLKHF